MDTNNLPLTPHDPNPLLRLQRAVLPTLCNYLLCCILRRVLSYPSIDHNPDPEPSTHSTASMHSSPIHPQSKYDANKERNNRYKEKALQAQ